jgi:RimJ/RimL family protein N-acetyltransferase
MNSSTIFATPRLIARRWTLDDVDAAFAMYGDPDVQRYLGRNGAADVVANVDEMRDRLQKLIEKYEGPFAGYIAAAMARSDTGEVVGTGLLKPLELSSGERAEEIEIGWHLAKKHWGQGYGTEIGRELVEHGFKQMRLPELHAIAYPENKASLRIMQKLGMEYQGRTDRYYGVTVDHYLLRA